MRSFWLCGIALGCALGMIVPSASAARPLKAIFTIDDLPEHAELPPGVSRVDVARSILQTLKAKHLPRVYGFVNAADLVDEPETMQVLQLWRQAGEPVGNHTYSHADLNRTSAEAFEKDIEADEPLLKQLAGKQDWHVFRYPYLHEGETAEKREAVQRWLDARGYKVAEVSVDFEDYLWNDPYARCLAKGDTAAIADLERSYLETADRYIREYRELSHMLYGRDIPYVVLLHIGAFDARMMPQLVDLLRQRGFTFETLEKAQRDPAYALRAQRSRGWAEFQGVSRKLKFAAGSAEYERLEGMCREGGAGRAVILERWKP